MRHRERTFRFPEFPLKFRWKTFSWGNYASEIFFGHFKIGTSEAGVLKRESCDCKLIWKIYGFENPRIWNMRKIWLLRSKEKGCLAFDIFGWNAVTWRGSEQIQQGACGKKMRFRNWEFLEMGLGQNDGKRETPYFWFSGRVSLCFSFENEFKFQIVLLAWENWMMTWRNLGAIWEEEK